MRYQLLLPVIFQWTDSQGATHKEGGFTRNIGSRGVYLVGPVCPPEKSTIELEVLLPVMWRQSPHCAKLVATLTVVRVQKMNEQWGFAAAGDLDQIRGTNEEGIEDLMKLPIANRTARGEDA